MKNYFFKKIFLIIFLILFSQNVLSLQETYFVPMRDGVKLATEVYRNENSPPSPAILLRTPYGRKSLIPKWIIEEFLKKGYVYVSQDMRGRGDSEGESFVFLDDGWGERQDGYDTVEWIARQPWCNGKVGTFGPSAMGIVQNLMAGAKPPNLVCQVIIVAASSLYHEGAFQGGAFRLGLAGGWLKMNKFPAKILREFKSHPNYDNMWELVNSRTKHNIMNVPALHIGGWFDIFQEGTLQSFKGRQENGAPGARGKQLLVMGPWTHNIGEQPRGELKFPDAETLYTKLKDKIVRFFDYYLKGIDTNITKEKPVEYYLMGDVDEKGDWNCWKTADKWPPTSKNLKFYLRENKILSLEKPSKEEIPDKFIYDPLTPVPTFGGCNLNELLEGPAGPRDQRKIEERSDVLIWTSDVLDKPLKVVGKIKVILYASSSAKDTDFTAKLTDVYPDGRSILICDGIIRARKRESDRKEVFMEPNKVYKFEIDLWSTAYVFNKGHKIRLAISSSNYPRFDVNPNTGEKFKIVNFNVDKYVVAHQTIFHSRKYPSHLILPVLEEESD
jgi:predicted acyl esterase